MLCLAGKPNHNPNAPSALTQGSRGQKYAKSSVSPMSQMASAAVGIQVSEELEAQGNELQGQNFELQS